MATEVKWYGDDLLKQIREATLDGLFEGANTLVEAAKSRAPYRSGDLQNSGYAAIPGKSTYKSDKQHNKEVKPKDGQAVAGFAIFYARFWEFGTKKLARKPFLRPALDELKDQIGGQIVARIGRKLK